MKWILKNWMASVFRVELMVSVLCQRCRRFVELIVAVVRVKMEACFNTTASALNCIWIWVAGKTRRSLKELLYVFVGVTGKLTLIIWNRGRIQYGVGAIWRVVISTSNSLEYENHSYFWVLQKRISKRHSFSGMMNCRKHFIGRFCLKSKGTWPNRLLVCHHGHKAG